MRLKVKANIQCTTAAESTVSLSVPRKTNGCVWFGVALRAIYKKLRRLTSATCEVCLNRAMTWPWALPNHQPVDSWRTTKGRPHAGHRDPVSYTHLTLPTILRV